MTDRDLSLEPFDALIGAWDTEATHPALAAVVPGAVTWEWLGGRHFLLVRSRHEHELFPDSLGVIGVPEGGKRLTMEYFDSRGVRRTYGASLAGGALRFWRDSTGFDQRFLATLGRDSFQGLWQLARTPDDWHDDLQLTYRRRSSG